jgi:hypothetical protein
MPTVKSITTRPNANVAYFTYDPTFITTIRNRYDFVGTYFRLGDNDLVRMQTITFSNTSVYYEWLNDPERQAVQSQHAAYNAANGITIETTIEE